MVASFAGLVLALLFLPDVHTWTSVGSLHAYFHRNH